MLALALSQQKSILYKTEQNGNTIVFELETKSTRAKLNLLRKLEIICRKDRMEIIWHACLLFFFS